MYVSSLLSRFMQNPCQIHFGAARRVLRYLQGTIDCDIFFKYVENPKFNGLLGFTDGDWAGSSDDCKNTSGYVFSFGSGVYSWASNKQNVWHFH